MLKAHSYVTVIHDESNMNRSDTIYQAAVDVEVDRLARLTPCELMQLEPESREVNTAEGRIQLTRLIFDGGDHRRIAVVVERPVLLGVAKRKFAGALDVQLRCERLSSDEIGDLYD